MKNKVMFFICLTFLIGFIEDSKADIIYLKGGGKISGSVLSETDNRVKIETKISVFTIDKAEVLKIEKERLTKENSAIESIVQKLEQRLKDANFLSKAPPLVREKEKQKLDALKDKSERLRQELLQLPSE